MFLYKIYLELSYFFDMGNFSASLTLTNKKTGVSKTADFAVLEATIGENCLDISKLHSEFGIFTFDPGYLSTGSCSSKITYIDGNKGILMHRGYKIEDLVAKKSFLEVAYLLLFEKFPTTIQLNNFHSKIVAGMQTTLSNIKPILACFNKNSHPMSILMAISAKLASIIDKKDYDIIDKKEKEESINEHAIMAIGAIAVAVASIHRHLTGKKPLAVRTDMDFSENFLYLMFADNKNYKPSQNAISAIDKLFILHADHEQNPSTSSVRAIGSTGANLFASLSGGISALWGPLHGGANEAVIKMILEIGNVENIDDYIKKSETGEVRLMGFGHRVYKNKDPRAMVIKEYCDKILAEADNPKVAKMLKIAKIVEQKALQEEYFIKRKLFPNVDFYSGIIYSAIGIPALMFTPLFAVARTAGWVSQWKEMLLGDDFKIIRPRQLYKGDINK